MSALVLTARRTWPRIAARTGDAATRPNLWALTLVALVAAVMVTRPEARDIVLAALSDAYIQVGTFVAASLVLFYGVQRLFGIDAGVLLKRHAAWQVPVAAFLGALPGCGGAIVVVTQYVRGRVGFGSVLAVLTATMGDAAFLLLAQEPLTGAGIFVLGFLVGTASGWLVEAIHGRAFMRHAHGPAQAPAAMPAPSADRERGLGAAWWALMAPGLVLGGLAAFQVDTDAIFTAAGLPGPTLWIGVAGSLLAVGMRAMGADRGVTAVFDGRDACDAKQCLDARVGGTDRVIADTNFVTVWVVLAFLSYELGVFLTGVDLQAVFAVWAPAVPLIAVLVGLLPGCGPQIVVTALYLGGVVPLSAQIGNAISNDGDALFPALAVAPRAALVATLYSAVPALVAAYAWWWLFE